MKRSIPSYGKSTTALSTVEKVGQLFMPAAFINDTEEEIVQLEQLITQHHIGALCFFHSRASAATNFEGKKKVVSNASSLQTLHTLIARYQKASKTPLLIAIDAEWGLAMRIENTTKFPYAITLGALQNNNDLITEVGQHISVDCKNSGIHWNLAPVVDINTNPNNPVIGYRSFGQDKTRVTQKAQAMLTGIQDGGGISCLKHFPGHGDTSVDSHLGLPVIQKTKDAIYKEELYPFKTLIASGVDSVMVGHLALPSLTNGEEIPATISKTIITEILRNELQFKGVIISDALNMHSVSKMFPKKGMLEWLAFDAGTDMLCFSEHVPEGIQTILERATSNDIEARFKNVWALKEKAFSERNTPTVKRNSTTLLAAIASKSITLAKGTESAVSLLKNQVSKVYSIGARNASYFSYTIAPFLTGNNEDVALIALYPPQIKPSQNFGFAANDIAIVNTLLKTKKCTVYLFGNPLSVQIFDLHNAENLILVYENGQPFQEVAVQHVLGNITAVGSVPVELPSL